MTALLVFLHMMRDRKSVLVAGRMGLTQSSISHALNRLRDVFGDPLFLRKPHGMEPTAIAIALEPAIRAAVERVADALARPQDFDPSTATSTVRIAAFDSQLSVLVPEMIALADREAPGLTVVARALGRGEALDALEDGSVDLAVGFFWDLPPAFLATPLHHEGYLTVARQGHPVLSGPLDVARFTAFRHLLVSPAGDLTGIVDQALAALGMTRTVACAVPLFFPGLVTLAGSDLVATLPEGLVRRFAPAFSLGFREPPLEIRRFEVSIVRHRRNARNAMLDWLIHRLGSALPSGTPV